MPDENYLELHCLVIYNVKGKCINYDKRNLANYIKWLLCIELLIFFCCDLINEWLSEKGELFAVAYCTELL